MDYVAPNSIPPNGGSGSEEATNLVRAQWDMVHNPAIFTPLQSDEDGAMWLYTVRKDPDKVKKILDFLRNSYIESASDIVNIFELGVPDKIQGEVELMPGCTSLVKIELGADVWAEKKIEIHKEEMLESDRSYIAPIENIHAMYYFDKTRTGEPKVALDISCRNERKYLVKQYITGGIMNDVYCIDPPDCNNIEEDYSTEITSILNDIRNANIDGTKQTVINWPTNEYNTPKVISGCKVKLYKDFEFKVLIHKMRNTQIVNTGYSNIIFDSYNNPTSRWDIVKVFLNKFGASFDVGEFSGEKRLRLISFFDKDSPESELRIMVEDRYANLLGNYLFGDGWVNDFNEEDRQWVLYLYSPQISLKFEAVKDNIEDNLLEQRRLTYYALVNKFSDDHISRIAGNSNSFLSQYNYAAQLKHNTSAKNKGVSIYTYTAEEGLKISTDPIHYHHNPIIGKDDIFYPVDVKLWDMDNNKPSLGNVYYSAKDFRGTYTEGTFAIGPPQVGGGVIAGYLKGFGYTEFSYALAGGTSTYTVELSGEAGVIDGSYTLGKGIPTPLNFQGVGTNLTISAGDFRLPFGFAMSSWKGFDQGTQVWEGISVALDFTLSIERVLLPVTLSKVDIVTLLHFPSLNKTPEETIKILTENEYYKGE